MKTDRPVSDSVPMTNRKIADNVRILALARGVTASSTLVVTVYLGRVLGPEGFGVLNWGAAALAFFVLLPNLGLNVLGVREVARNSEKVVYLVDRVLTLRLLLATLALVGYLGMVGLLDKPMSFKLVVAVQGFVLYGHAISLEWVFEGTQRMRLLAFRNVIVAAFSLGGVLLLVRNADDLLWAAVLTVAPILLGNLWFFSLYVREFTTPKPTVDSAAWAGLARSGVPIALSLFMTAVYASTDQVMLGLFRSDAEVGAYGAAYRLVVAAMIPTSIVLQAFMPTLSQSLGDLAAMRHRGRQFMSALLAIGFPLAALGVGMAPELMKIYGSAYAEASGTLAILLGTVALSYVGVGLGRTLVAWNREQLYLWALGGGAVFNVVANYLVIPAHGYAGAAWMTLASEALALVVVAVFHYQTVQQHYVPLLARGAVVVAIAVGLPFILGGALGVSPYFSLALAVGGYAALGQATGLFDLRALFELLRP